MHFKCQTGYSVKISVMTAPPQFYYFFSFIDSHYDMMNEVIELKLNTFFFQQRHI